MRFLVSIVLFCSINIFSQTVYKTPSGSKYHLSSCRMVKNVSSQLSVSKAGELGLLPCKICQPPRSSVLGIASSPSKKTNGVNASNRCKGTTKVGARCKRNTRIGNDYCFQHLP